MWDRDKRFKTGYKGNLGKETLIGVLIVICLIIYFVYVYLFAILPIILVFLTYSVLKDIFNKKFTILSTFSILLIYIISLGLMTVLFPQWELSEFGYKFEGSYVFKFSHIIISSLISLLSTITLFFYLRTRKDTLLEKVE